MPPHNRPAQQWTIYRNGQIDPTLQVLRIDETCGGGRCDLAELIVDPKFAPKLQDFNPTAAVGNIIEVVADPNYVKHFGVVTMHQPHFSPGGETIKYVSRTEPAHFGEPAGGVLMFAPGVPFLRAPGWLEQPQGQFKRVDDPIVFNPEIDGRAVGNMHSAKLYGAAQMNVFLDPESVRTAAGRELHGGSAIFWPLSAAVHYLCWGYNGSQSFVANPTRAELTAVFRDSVDLLRNAMVADGDYLPEILDKLLAPLGYYWKLARRRFEQKLTFFRRGTGGRLVWLKHQRYGEIFDPGKTNTEATGVAFDASRLVNRIVGRGSKLQIEITAELVRGWPEEIDNAVDRDDLSKKVIGENLVENQGALATVAGRKNAWRKWVLNEAGDYIGTRGLTTIFTEPTRARLQAAGLLDWLVPRRRRLLPTLTRDRNGDGPIGTLRGVEVELGAPLVGSETGEYEWTPIGDWGVLILEHEAGILINGEDIPEELFDLGDEAKLRVTATIETDFRITATAPRQPLSPIFYDATAQLDLDQDFHWRTVSPLSKYHGRIVETLPSSPTVTAFTSIDADDREALQAFVATLRDRWDQLDVAGNVVLEGVDQHAYQLGDRVAGIEGRNYKFQSRFSGGTHPQIIGITYDVDGQKTILHLERIRELVIG
jgi:hypothetical protein